MPVTSPALAPNQRRTISAKVRTSTVGGFDATRHVAELAGVTAQTSAAMSRTLRRGILAAP